MKRFKILLTVIISLFVLQAFAGEAEKTIELSSLGNPDWTYVTQGDILCAPERTEGGYLYVLDGKMSLLLSDEGKAQWLKRFRTRLKPFFNENEDSFSYLVISPKKACAMNPDGTEIFRMETDEEIIEKPCPGLDGRVFIRTKNTIYCYGTKGKLKWKTQIKDQYTEIPLLNFNDGSLLVLTGTKNTPEALRLSPFGSIIEKTSLNAKPVKAEETDKGIMLLNDDMSLSLLAAENSTMKVLWILKKEQSGLTPSASFIKGPVKKNTAILFIPSSSSTLMIIDIEKGKILKKISVPLIKTQDLVFAGHTRQGIVIADRSCACCFSEDGRNEWNVTYEKKKKWNYLYADDRGNLVFCNNDWSIDAWCIKQTAMDKQKEEKQEKSYASLYKDKDAKKYRLMTSSSIQKLLRDGSYAEKEGEILEYLREETDSIYADWNKNTALEAKSDIPYYQSNIQFNQNIFTLLGETESTELNDNMYLMLEEIENTTVLACLVRECGRAGYDKDLMFLDAFYDIVQKKTVRKDAELSAAICDATFAICSFMGKEALNSKGKLIVSYLLQPQFDAKIQNYARSTMQKMGKAFEKR